MGRYDLDSLGVPPPTMSPTNSKRFVRLRIFGKPGRSLEDAEFYLWGVYPNGRRWRLATIACDPISAGFIATATANTMGMGFAAVETAGAWR